jgi:hypothetical protein
MAETTETIERTTWVPVAPFVTIEEMFKSAGITRDTFTGQGPVLPSVLRLTTNPNLDKCKYDFYDHDDCYFYEKGGKKEYIKGTRMIVQFGKLSRDDFYFLREEVGTFFKYEITIHGRKMYIVISYADYQKLVHDDRVYLSSLPRV